MPVPQKKENNYLINLVRDFNMKNLTIILLLLGLIGCSGNDDTNTIEESGTIETKDVIVSAQVGGVILKQLRDEGDIVKEGDTLLIIDHESLDLQLKQSEALEQGAKAQYDLLINGARKEDIKSSGELLNQAKANFELAEKDYNRMKNLYDLQAITKKQYDEAETRFTVTKSQLTAAEQSFNKIKNLARTEEKEQAKANLDKSSAAVLLIKKSIKDCYVTSPLNGVIAKRFNEKGEYIAPLGSLFKISNQDDIEIKIYISETDLGKVKIGQEAKISVDSYKDKTYNGKVIYISPEAEFTPKNIQTKDERTKLVYAVKIKVKNENGELKNGMPADAIINLN